MRKAVLAAVLSIAAVVAAWALVPSGVGSARTVDVRIAQERFELCAAGDGYRLVSRDAERPTRVLTRGELERLLGPDVVVRLFDAPPNLLFEVFNITSWTSLAWVALGLLGQLAFFLRMLAQWLASERRREVVVPEAFWWLSLAGGIALFTYFVWRVDIVGVLGQTTGVVVYARNLWLIRQRRARDGASAALRGGVAPGESAAAR